MAYRCDMCRTKGTLYRKRGLHLCKTCIETVDEIEDEED